MIEDQVYEQLNDASKRLEPSNISFLQELVRTPSTNPPGDYEEIHSTLTRHFTANEWEVETLWAPDELLEELSMEHPRPNVLAWVTRGDGPTIALRSHSDTAPVDESLWEVDPCGGEIEDGVLYGRGATDEKG